MSKRLNTKVGMSIILVLLLICAFFSYVAAQESGMESLGYAIGAIKDAKGFGKALALKSLTAKNPEAGQLIGFYNDPIDTIFTSYLNENPELKKNWGEVQGVTSWLQIPTSAAWKQVDAQLQNDPEYQEFKQMHGIFKSLKNPSWQTLTQLAPGSPGVQEVSNMMSMTQNPMNILPKDLQKLYQTSKEVQE